MKVKSMISLKKAMALVLAAVMALSAAFAVLPASAQEISPEHLATARKFVDLTNKGQTYELAIVRFGVDTLKVIVQQNPEIAEQAKAAITKTLDYYRDRKGELLDQFARVYALRFTAEELQQIIDFYSSPIGQKLAESNDEVNRDMQNVMSVFRNNTGAQFFAQVRAELKAQGVEL